MTTVSVLLQDDQHNYHADRKKSPYNCQIHLLLNQILNEYLSSTELNKNKAILLLKEKGQFSFRQYSFIKSNVLKLFLKCINGTTYQITTLPDKECEMYVQRPGHFICYLLGI